MENAREFAVGEVKKLDEWCNGMLFGTVFATVFWFVMAWAVMEPLK